MAETKDETSPSNLTVKDVGERMKTDKKYSHSKSVLRCFTDRELLTELKERGYGRSLKT